MSFLDVNSDDVFTTATTLMNFSLNYGAVLLAVSGAVHFGLAVSSYGRSKIFESEKDAEEVVQAVKQIDSTGDYAAKSKLIDMINAKFTMQAKPGFSRLLWTLAGILAASSSMTLPALPAAVSIAVCSMAMVLYDFQCTKQGLAPHWFAAFKFWLTVSIVVSMLFTLAFYLVYSGLKSVSDAGKAAIAKAPRRPEMNYVKPRRVEQRIEIKE